MHLVKSTTACLSIFLCSVFLLIFSDLKAQENSPYSRYGLGDLVAGQNVANKGMGGIAAAYSDFGLINAPFNLNFINPASLGNLSNTKNFSNTIFELGTEIDVRTLKSNTTTDKFKATNVIVSYLQLGFPISTKKMERRGTTWGVSFGLRPLTRINYKIEQLGRIANVDSSKTIYEGNGGMNQVNVSTGIKKIGKGARRNEFSIGASSGYTFGTRDYSTRTSLINDSVTYYKSNYQVESRFGGVFINTGVQYEMHLKDAGTLRLGAYANLKQNLNAYQTTRIETFGFDGNGGIAPIDSVYKMTDVKGKVIVPVIFGIGFTFRSKDNQWLFGADYEFSNWASYRSYNEKDYTANSWTIRAGAEFYPAKSTAADNKYWNYIKYRAGFYYGPDYIYINAVRKNYAATLGASLPLTSPRFIQSRGEYVCLNTSLEYGVRGNRESLGLRESFMRINFGISMNARWFQKRSYD